MQRDNGPMPTTVQQDSYQKPAAGAAVCNVINGNLSDPVFKSLGEGEYQTEAQAQFAMHNGRPATSKRPPRREDGDKTFYGKTSYARDFKGKPGSRALIDGPPRAARSEIGESKLFHHVRDCGIDYTSEARRNFNTKVYVRQQGHKLQEEGIGFGSLNSPDNRTFSTEVRQNYLQKAAERPTRPKWSEPERYNKVEDDRVFQSESAAAMADAAAVITQQQIQKSGRASAQPSRQQSGRASAQLSRQPSIPASVAQSRLPTGMKPLDIASQKSSRLQTGQQIMSGRRSSRKPTQYIPAPKFKSQTPRHNHPRTKDDNSSGIPRYTRG
jgi:hypothetical protein